MAYPGPSPVTVSSVIDTLMQAANQAAALTAIGAAPAAGVATIVTVGTITGGTWHGTAIADTYIASAATWNAKLSGNQTITISGDGSGSGATAITLTVTKLNGTTLSGLATGILKNTTGTGVPTIATAGTDYVAPAALANYATLASPALTGTPTAPTATTGTNTTQLATTAFVIANAGGGSSYTFSTGLTNTSGTVTLGDVEMSYSDGLITLQPNSLGNALVINNPSGSTTVKIDSYGQAVFSGYIESGYFLQTDGLAILGLNSAFTMGSEYVINWNSTNFYSGTADIGIVRSSAGVLAITNGSTGLGALTLSGLIPVLGGDATGDMYYLNSSGQLTRLGIGSGFNTLIVGAGSIPAWGTLAGGVVATGNTSTTGTQTSVVTFTTTNDGNSRTYSVSAYANITAVSAGTLTATITFTDENGTSRTITLYPMGLTSSGLTATGFTAFAVATIRAQANTTAALNYIFTGVSIAYDAGGAISQLTP